MNCKEIQELIMTDYIDGEIEEKLEKEVREHLKSCSRCQEFEGSLRKEAIEPFKKVEPVSPPEFTWSKIKRRIEEEKTKGWLAGLGDGLRAIFTIRKPAVAAATIAVVILIIAVIFTQLPFSRRNGLNEYLAEQAEFLSYLDKEETSSLDLGTNLEEYFL